MYKVIVILLDVAISFNLSRCHQLSHQGKQLKQYPKHLRRLSVICIQISDSPRRTKRGSIPVVTKYDAPVKAVLTMTCGSYLSSFFRTKNHNIHVVAKMTEKSGGAETMPVIALLSYRLTNSTPTDTPSFLGSCLRDCSKLLSSSASFLLPSSTRLG